MTQQASPVPGSIPAGMPDIRGYDPANPPPLEFRFYGKLRRDEYAPSSPEYTTAAHLPRPIWQWQQEYEAADWRRVDGTPGIFTNSINLESISTDTNGVSVSRWQGEGGPAQVLALARIGMGMPANPADPKAAEWIGHWFELKSVSVPRGKFKPARVYLPIKHLGTSFIYTGDVHTFKSKDADSESTSEGSTPLPPMSSEADEVVALRIVKLLDGTPRSSAMSVVFKSPDGRRPQLFGRPMLAGFSSGDLIDDLVARGFLTDDNGVLRAVVS